ncbi:MAG: ATP/GTP-binding protein [Chloroflexota bacterium]|nr:ATP/GTP-binding protein [Chloroflexota bacterium]
MSSYKVIVTGTFNSGKTQFIKTISDIPVVATEKAVTTEDRSIKAETTVAMDYGRVALDSDTLYLYGTPGQARFDFMRDILQKEMQAFIVLVDSSDPPSFPEAAEIIEQFLGYARVPYLVVANKSDLPTAAKISEIQRGTRLGGTVTIMPCNATQKSSIRQVLREVLSMLKSS